MRLENICDVDGVSPQQTNEQFEKIASSTEKIGNIIEKIPEKIQNDSEKIGIASEKILEKIRYRGQRGADKSARRLNANSLRNLRQYPNIPIAKPNSDKWLWIVLAIAVALVLGLLIWELYQRRKKDSED